MARKTKPKNHAKSKKGGEMKNGGVIKGEGALTSMLQLADLEQNPSVCIAPDVARKIQNQEPEEMKQDECAIIYVGRRNIFPQKQLCIVECFHSTINQFETYKFDNVFGMCLSFIIKSSEKILIRPGCSATVKTDFIFNSFKPKHFKNLRKQSRENEFGELFSRLKFHIWNLDWSIQNEKVYVKYKEGFLKNVVDEPFEVEILNYCPSEFIIEPQTHLGKIYFYAQ